MKALRLLLILTFGSSLTWQTAAADNLLNDPASGIEFVRIPSGCFWMGVDTPGKLAPGFPIPVPAPDEIPRHEVCVKSFWLGRSEVTRKQWTLVTGRSADGIDRPIANVTWDDAVGFTRRLTDLGNARYRLPTEAEWEYACHAGQLRAAIQAIGEDRIKLLEDTYRFAWYRYQSGRNPQVHPVMTKMPNAWGLFDMLGNLWEWTADGYDPTAYSKHQKDSPTVPPVDERRVIRGGSYKTDIARVRCSARSYAPAEERMPVIGFRVVREID